MKNSLAPALALLWAAVPVVIVSAQTPPAPAVPPVGGAAGASAQVPDKWSTEAYRFASYELSAGFVSREKGQLRAPAMPKADAKTEELVDFLRKSDVAALQYLRSQGIVLPEGSLAAYDGANQTLVLRTSGRGHEQVQMLARSFLSALPATLNLATYLIEADANVVRELLAESAGKGDHSPQLARLRTLVGEGKARQVNYLRVETRSGQRATVNGGEERLLGQEYVGYKNSIAEVTHDMQLVGTSVEIDPVIGPDGETIDVNYALRHHYRAPVDRWEPVGQTPAGVRTDIRVTDLYTVHVTSSQTMLTGTSRFMGVWKPEGAPEPGRENVLLVAMLRADVVKLLRAEDERLKRIVVAQGETVRATPATVPVEFQDPAMPNGMIIRRFRVTPSLLSMGVSRDSAAGAAPAADPFSAAPPPDEMRMTVRATSLDILRSQGIEFPKGSSANFISATSELIVRNTPENMAEVEALVESLQKSLPLNVSLRVQLVQAEGAFLRKLEEEYAASADHGAMWKAVTDAVAQGRAKYVQTLWVGTRSGQRALTEVGREYSYVTEAGGAFSPRKTPSNPPAATENDKAKPNQEQASASIAQNGPKPETVDPGVVAYIETRRAGLTFELDPVIGPDGQTLDINFVLDRHYTQPTWRAPLASEEAKVIKIDAPATSFHQAKTTMAITSLSGLTRLISLWKPEGSPEFENADIMQAAFLQTDVEPVGK